jgi:heme-degrading monooxygenase HmoA
MIARVWHGFTMPENADKYEKMLRENILPGIGRVAGYKGAQLLRRNHKTESEFAVTTYFEDLQSVIAFAGEDYTKAVVEPEARKLLTRCNIRAAHYDLVDMIALNDLMKFTHSTI